jgi:glycosyltransferase involved in cell wall biosynthesis
MKIYLDNALGHITIARMLPYWMKMGHSITSSPSDIFDVQLSYVKISGRRKPTTLRLDGIYYDSDTNYQSRNSEINTSHSIADAVIYQSEYSRILIEKYIKPRKPTALYEVIYNGINDDWCSPPEPHDGINITLISKFRRHKRLKEMVELFVEFHKEYDKSYLHIFGEPHANRPVKHSNITYYGMVDRIKMLKILSRTDFSIHLSKRDSCPNSVVECIGAGIPVITTNNCGGATEICRMTPGCIVVDGDGDYNDLSPVPHYRDDWNILSPQLFSDILSAMRSLAVNKTRVVLPDQLHASYMAKEYIKIMEALK